MQNQPGFAPIDFQMVGRILLALGILGILLKGISYLIGCIGVPNTIFHIGLASVIVGIYLIFVVPKK